MFRSFFPSVTCTQRLLFFLLSLSIMNEQHSFPLTTGFQLESLGGWGEKERKRMSKRWERATKRKRKMSKLMGSDALLLLLFCISFIHFERLLFLLLLFNVSRGHFSCLFYPLFSAHDSLEQFPCFHYFPCLTHFLSIPMSPSRLVFVRRVAVHELWTFNNSNQRNCMWGGDGI